MDEKNFWMRGSVGGGVGGVGSVGGVGGVGGVGIGVGGGTAALDGTIHVDVSVGFAFGVAASMSTWKIMSAAARVQTSKIFYVDNDADVDVSTSASASEKKEKMKGGIRRRRCCYSRSLYICKCTKFIRVVKRKKRVKDLSEYNLSSESRRRRRRGIDADSRCTYILYSGSPDPIAFLPCSLHS